MDEIEKADERARVRQRRDSEDLQAELAGANTGRPRFLTQEQIDDNRDPSRSSAAKDAAFWEWVRSAEYAARTQALSKNLNDALIATDKALIENAKKIREAEERLEDVRRRAQRLDDGRLVYRARDGRVFTDDDRQLPSHEAARVPRVPGTSTWEKRKAAKDEYQDSLKERKVLTRYREKIVKYRDRLKSDEPLSPQELESMENDVKDAPATARSYLQQDSRTASASRAYTDGAIEGPSVSNAFQRATEGTYPARQVTQSAPTVPRGPAPS